MRVNVYAEELTSETELVTKVVDAGTENERTFYGVRVFLKSPIELHDSEHDDDRSAVTFWVPWTKADGHDFFLVQSLMVNLHARIGEAVTKELSKKVKARREPAVV